MLRLKIERPRIALTVSVTFSHRRNHTGVVKVLDTNDTGGHQTTGKNLAYCIGKNVAYRKRSRGGFNNDPTPHCCLGRRRLLRHTPSTQKEAGHGATDGRAVVKQAQCIGETQRYTNTNNNDAGNNNYNDNDNNNDNNNNNNYYYYYY